MENLPRHLRLELDPEVKKQLESDNRKLSFFKEHKGKFHRKTELPKKLEETINTILSGKRCSNSIGQIFDDSLEDVEPSRLKADVKLLQDHMAERRLPIEQKELHTIAQNVIQNFISTERKLHAEKTRSSHYHFPLLQPR